jgi:hypothetical protein
LNKIFFSPKPYSLLQRVVEVACIVKMSVIVEIGENPVMHDIHQERISSILKLYSIVTFQLLLTIVVVFVVVFVPPVVNFLNNSRHEGVLDIVTLFGTYVVFYNTLVFF